MTDEQNHQAENRFKAEMPQIPGVGQAPAKASGPSGRLLILLGAAAVLAAAFVAFKLVSKPKRAEPAPPTAQIEVPTPATNPDLTAAVPSIPEQGPGVARIGDFTKAWDSIQFTFRDATSGENVTGFLIRLPGGSGAQASGYWSFASRAPFGNCQLEFILDLAKLRTDYGFVQAAHPMVGDPCSRTVFDPLKYGSIPGNALARGAVVQGSDLRPPLGIQIQIKGKDIFAIRKE